MTNQSEKFSRPHLAEPFPSEQKVQAPNPLVILQQQYGLVRLTGALHVVDRYALGLPADNGTAQRFEPLRRADATLLMLRTVKDQFPEANAKAVVSEFFTHPETACYSGIDFNPTSTSVNSLNLWVKPTITPCDGSSKLIRDFLLNVICSGNRTNFSYLVKYLAHALQRPEEKPGVMVILLGGQGTGKGTLARILQKIWSATYLHVHQIKSVTGDFNGSLERAFIVWLDEAFFAGNRGATDSLKSLVTEPVIHINEKFQPARQTKSVHRFFGASNADHYKATDRDDRRDFVLRVSDGHKGDHEYWDALYREIDNGGVEAMVQVLLSKDLSNFNVRAKPSTQELTRQKLKSLDSIPSWWYGCLRDGEIETGMRWPSFVSTNDAILAASNDSAGKYSGKPSAFELVQTIKKLCPSVRKVQSIADQTRKRGLALPTLKQARSEFEGYIGGRIKW